jgi:hypothetical protein
MRIAFTIIFNGLHHLQHNNYLETLLPTFDYWVFVEGACNPTGSTRWCQPILDKYHNKGHSIDGTLEYLRNMANSNRKVILIENNGFWSNKDDMVNAAMAFINSKCPDFFWQIDCDEFWTQDQIVASEYLLRNSKGNTGTFLSEYYVKDRLIAIGDWGEGRKLPYNRLWKHNGKLFKCHEPPILEGGNGKVSLLPARFKHYAYCYESDVLFKQDFYGYDNLYKNWLALDEMIPPISISYFLTDKNWSKSKTLIVSSRTDQEERLSLLNKYFHQ